MNQNSKQPRPGTRTRRATMALAGMLLLPCFSGLQAAAPGSAQVESHIHQPLQVRIPLHAVGPDDIGQLSVRLAPEQRYQAADIAPPAFLDEMSVDLRVDGDQVNAHITSRTPVREPFLRLMIEVERSNQRLVRDYTLLLDPPPAATAQAATPETQESVSTAEATPPVTEAPAPESAPDRSDRFGPVARGMSLWVVAEAVRPPDISVYQTMVALFRENPGAFADGDPGHLRAGAELTIPAADEIAAIPRAEAVTAYQSWLGEPPEAPATPPSLVAESLADIPAREAPAVPADIEPEFRQPAIEALAGYWAAEPLTVADNGGAREIGPIESRLDRIESRLAELESGLVGETGPALSDQSASLERLEQRLAGIDTRLAEMADRRQIGNPADYPPAAVIASIAALTFLLGMLAGRLVPGRSHRTGVAAVAIPAPRVRMPLWRRLGGILRRSAPEERSRNNRGQAGADGRTRRAETIPLSGYAAPPDASGIEASVEEGTATAREIAAEVATDVEPPPTQSGQSDTDQAQTDDVDRDDPPPTAVDLDALPPAPDPDDPVSLAELYLAEDLPRDAADLLRSAIASHDDAPAAWWLKLLDCLRLADDRTAFFEEARRFLDIGADAESWNKVLALARAFDPEHTLPREIPGTHPETVTGGHSDEDGTETGAVDGNTTDRSTLVPPEPAAAPSPESRQDVTVTTEPTGTDKTEGVIEFDLPDMPDLEDARPVHGGAPSELADTARMARDAESPQEGAADADAPLFNPGPDSVEEIELSDANPETMPHVLDDEDGDTFADIPDTMSDATWETPDETVVEDAAGEISFDELERDFQSNHDALDEGGDENTEYGAAADDPGEPPDLDDIPVDDMLHDTAAAVEENDHEESVIDFDTFAAELEAASAAHHDADTSESGDRHAAGEDAAQPTGDRKTDRRASRG